MNEVREIKQNQCGDDDDDDEWYSRIHFFLLSSHLSDSLFLQ